MLACIRAYGMKEGGSEAGLRFSERKKGGRGFIQKHLPQEFLTIQVSAV